MKLIGRDGNEMTKEEWIKALKDGEYKVARDTLPNGMHVRTTWLGCDMRHEGDDVSPPLIYDTTVMAREPSEGLLRRAVVTQQVLGIEAGDQVMGVRESVRYATEAAALTGHRQIVEKLMEEQS